MKKIHDNRYSGISSFDDFRSEREQLEFRMNLIEAKLKLSYHMFRERFSLSNLFASFTRDIILPKANGFLGNLFSKEEKDSSPESENTQ